MQVFTDSLAGNTGIGSTKGHLFLDGKVTEEGVNSGCSWSKVQLEEENKSPEMTEYENSPSKPTFDLSPIDSSLRHRRKDYFSDFVEDFEAEECNFIKEEEYLEKKAIKLIELEERQRDAQTECPDKTPEPRKRNSNFAEENCKKIHNSDDRGSDAALKETVPGNSIMPTPPSMLKSRTECGKNHSESTKATPLMPNNNSLSPMEGGSNVAAFTLFEEEKEQKSGKTETTHHFPKALERVLLSEFSPVREPTASMSLTLDPSNTNELLPTKARAMKACEMPLQMKDQ